EGVRCSPTVTGTPGCTVLAVPQPGAAGTRLTAVPPLVVEPAISPSPVPTIVSPTPSPVTPSAPTQGGATRSGAPGGG
ncbi:MAG TPA: hypothetical protein VE669_10250, partial [Actinomycetota bacterium]|nr:hypothetical protein [Actinomycetota bacterium]